MTGADRADADAVVRSVGADGQVARIATVMVGVVAASWSSGAVTVMTWESPSCRA
ncbi:MAG: hypothetical protein R2851_16785 [Caldilineaceae bacterium]